MIGVNWNTFYLRLSLFPCLDPRLCRTVPRGTTKRVAHVGALVLFLLFAALQQIALGLIGRIARSIIARGQKQNRDTMVYDSQQ